MYLKKNLNNIVWWSKSSVAKTKFG